jgi:hypothetical protein
MSALTETIKLKGGDFEYAELTIMGQDKHIIPPTRTFINLVTTIPTFNAIW